MSSGGVPMQIKLISLLTSCGLKVDNSSLGEVIETHLNQAAQARYRSLRATIGKPRGADRQTSHLSRITKPYFETISASPACLLGVKAACIACLGLLRQTPLLGTPQSCCGCAQ